MSRCTDQTFLGQYQFPFLQFLTLRRPFFLKDIEELEEKYPAVNIVSLQAFNPMENEGIPRVVHQRKCPIIKPFVVVVVVVLPNFKVFNDLFLIHLPITSALLINYNN